MNRPQFLAIILILVLVGAAAAAWTVWTLVTTRAVSVTELRAGTDFSLSGVRFRQTGYSDGCTSSPPMPDASITVTFNISFPDGAGEAFMFSFDG